jgi:hypothetical protein
MEYFIMLFGIVGVGYTSYMIGLRDGGAKMIDSLEFLKIIVVDENDNVAPNKSYDSK